MTTKRKPGRPKGTTKPPTTSIAVRLPTEAIAKLMRQPGLTVSEKLRRVLEALG